MHSHLDLKPRISMNTDFYQISVCWGFLFLNTNFYAEMMNTRIHISYFLCLFAQCMWQILVFCYSKNFHTVSIKYKQVINLVIFYKAELFLLFWYQRWQKLKSWLIENLDILSKVHCHHIPRSAHIAIVMMMCVTLLNYYWHYMTRIK